MRHVRNPSGNHFFVPGKRNNVFGWPRALSLAPAVWLTPSLSLSINISLSLSLSLSLTLSLSVCPSLALLSNVFSRSPSLLSHSVLFSSHIFLLSLSVRLFLSPSIFPLCLPSSGNVRGYSHVKLKAQGCLILYTHTQTDTHTHRQTNT